MLQIDSNLKLVVCTRAVQSTIFLKSRKGEIPSCLLPENDF